MPRPLGPNSSSPHSCPRRPTRAASRWCACCPTAGFYLAMLRKGGTVVTAATIRCVSGQARARTPPPQPWHLFCFPRAPPVLSLLRKEPSDGQQHGGLMRFSCMNATRTCAGRPAACVVDHARPSGAVPRHPCASRAARRTCAHMRRFFGSKFAEMPFVSTRDGFRRAGHCKRLMKVMGWGGSILCAHARTGARARPGAYISHMTTSSSCIDTGCMHVTATNAGQLVTHAHADDDLPTPPHPATHTRPPP